jgi:phage gp36-like protein
MAYATLQDFTDRFGAAELTQLTGSAGMTAALQRALDDAAAEIDGYLATRYALPLSTVPTVLVRVGCDIARYRLWDQAASEEVAARYASAVQFLTSVSKGIVQLGIDPPPPAGGANALPIVSSGTSRMTDDRLDDYVIGRVAGGWR